MLFERLLHDLKQPLNVIRIVAQSLRLDIKKDRLEVELLPDSMTEIEDAVDQLVQRIDQLRIFTKPKSSEQLDVWVELSQVCWAVLERFRQIYPDLKLSSSIVDGLKVSGIDECNLEHALWELLDNGANSVENAPHGKPSLWISTYESHNYAIVEVRDNGSGVSEKVKSSLFDPFVTTRTQSAGLGLTLAKALVTIANGRIELVDSSDEGSLFRIVLQRR